jgi:hypothetical protein
MDLIKFIALGALKENKILSKHFIDREDVGNTQYINKAEELIQLHTHPTQPINNELGKWHFTFHNNICLIMCADRKFLNAEADSVIAHIKTEIIAKFPQLPDSPQPTLCIPVGTSPIGEALKTMEVSPSRIEEIEVQIRETENKSKEEFIISPERVKSFNQNLVRDKVVISSGCRKAKIALVASVSIISIGIYIAMEIINKWKIK